MAQSAMVGKAWVTVGSLPSSLPHTLVEQEEETKQGPIGTSSPTHNDLLLSTRPHLLEIPELSKTSAPTRYMSLLRHFIFKAQLMDCGLSMVQTPEDYPR